MKIPASIADVAGLLPDSRSRFSRVGLPLGQTGSFDIVVEGARIARIENESSQPPQALLLPPLVDLHLHANRAFSIGSILPTSLDQAIQMSVETFRDHRAIDYARHAARLFTQALRHGTTRIRTHADVSRHIGLEALTGTLVAAEGFASTIDVEVVAFASSCVDPVDADARALLRDAVQGGARLLGAAPAYCGDARATIDALLDLAVELGVPVDLHVDEHLLAEQSVSGHLAAATIARGLVGMVTLSHGCAIAVLNDTQRRRVIEQLARAQVTVIALPNTNLFLQDRHSTAALRRGLAPLNQLLEGGVQVRVGSDNVQDAFFPYGKADLIEIAQTAAITGHLDEPRKILEAICNGRSRIQVGDDASFVLVPGACFAELLSAPVEGRVVVKNGVMLNPRAKATLIDQHSCHVGAQLPSKAIR